MFACFTFRQIFTNTGAVKGVFIAILLSGCSADTDNGSTTKTTTLVPPANENITRRTGQNTSAQSSAEISTAAEGVAQVKLDNHSYNAEAVIPPQCYTKHESQYNPCQVCHQTYPFNSRPNAMEDGSLQREYAFSDFGATNRWSNLFEDRSARIQAISDNEILDWINTDNYSPLINHLKANENWRGPIPDLKNLHLGAKAFDELGFAKDGSRWVAFNYKPVPSTFWPTNGSTDDVMIRLPEQFSKASCSGNDYSHDAYIANLSLLEMAIKDLASINTPPIDETAICEDINFDGVLSTVTQIQRREFYVGDANDEKVHVMLYPVGTEFLHSVRYVGLNDSHQVVVPARMKELRYMKKQRFLTKASLLSAYGNEHQEKIDENLPNYVYREDRGSTNDFGWQLLGFIEAKEGHLRMQNREETLFCMGCHSTIGTTIDQTFAFARKVPGAKGWGYINLHDLEDAPTKGKTEGEYLSYMRDVGGGDEFRQNQEMREKWFDDDGNLLTNAVKAADVYTLITPSPRRALDLNKAYLTIVQDQDFIHGRDANLTPAVNVYRNVDENTPTLPAEKSREYDLRLDW